MRKPKGPVYDPIWEKPNLSLPRPQADVDVARLLDRPLKATNAARVNPAATSACSGPVYCPCGCGKRINCPCGCGR
jgi:hypothetical protein